MPMVSIEELQRYVGKKVGVSDWFHITQDCVNQFADVTGDHQFIHVDPAKAKETPLGGTIAHGFLTLALLAPMGEATALMIDGMNMGINYGLDKVRFLAPVMVGKRVRGHFTLTQLKERAPAVMQFTYDVSVEIEGEDKPALSASWISLQYI